MEFNPLLFLSTVGLFHIEMIISFLFFNPNLKKLREGLPFRIVMAVFLSFSLSFLFYFLAERFSWNYVTNLVIYLVMFFALIFDYFLIFDCSFKEALLVLTLSYCVQHISYQMIYLGFDCWIYQVVPITSETIYIALMCLSMFIQLFCNTLLGFFLQGIFKRNYKFSISSPKVFLFSSVTLVIVVALNTASLKFVNWFLPAGIIAALLCLLSCFLILFLTLGFFEKSKYRDEVIKMEMFYEEKLKQYEKSQEAVEYINIKCHDLRKKIRNFKNNTELLDKSEIENIASAIKIYDETYQTGNDTLDNLLITKSLALQNNGIELTIMCDGKQLDTFSKSDLISLFANIIDNAIEAVVKIKEKQNRYISLIVKAKAGFLYIEETNPYINDVKIKNDYVLTTKKDKFLHGYGTKSIAYIVKKYDGRLNYKLDNGIFSIRILIPLKQKEEAVKAVS